MPRRRHALNEKHLETLIARGLCVLRVSPEEWEEILETRRQGSRFSLHFPHGEARHAKRLTPFLVVVDGDSAELRLGLVHSVKATSTLDSRVVFDFVWPIAPHSLSALLAQVTDARLRVGTAKLASGQEGLHAVSRALGEALIRAVAGYPENAPAVTRIVAQLEQPTHYYDARAMQHDAIHLALKAFGASDEGARALFLPGASTELASVRLQEDAVIEHDARWIPGWHLSRSDLTGRAVFRQGEDELHVFTANKRPLEELFGVDLIYLNQRRRALVMVQYKMMEPKRGMRSPNTTSKLRIKASKEPEWKVWVDEQFKKELTRMKRFDRDLAPDGQYRLNPGAFFFKFVKRNAARSSAGIILSLGHLKQMLREGAASGPRGGLSISYRELAGHYLRGETFVDLVRSGYIGTRGATTQHLEELIERALVGGHAVVAAFQAAL